MMVGFHVSPLHLSPHLHRSHPPPLRLRGFVWAPSSYSPCCRAGQAENQGDGRLGLVWPSGLCPVSFLGFVHSIWASLPAIPPLSCAPCPCPLQDPLSVGLSSRPKEVPGGCMLADLGLQYRASPSTPTMQVKGLWVYAMLLKSNASSWVIKAHNQDKIYKSGQPRWWEKNYRWHGHGSVTRTCKTAPRVRRSLQNGHFTGFRHFLNASLGTQLANPCGISSCSACCYVRINLLPSRWTSVGSGTQSTTTVWT